MEFEISWLAQVQNNPKPAQLNRRLSGGVSQALELDVLMGMRRDAIYRHRSSSRGRLNRQQRRYDWRVMT